jgi:hypothetical protein
LTLKRNYPIYANKKKLQIWPIIHFCRAAGIIGLGRLYLGFRTSVTIQLDPLDSMIDDDLISDPPAIQVHWHPGIRVDTLRSSLMTRMVSLIFWDASSWTRIACG